MKGKWTVFVLSALLMLSLAGCGEQDRTNMSGDNTPPAGDESVLPDDGNSNAAGGDVLGGGNEDNSSENQQNSSLSQGEAESRSRWQEQQRSEQGEGLFGGKMDEGQDDLTLRRDGTVYGSYRAEGTATWRQMLDNGRVRDRDGFLLDGENPSW